MNGWERRNFLEIEINSFFLFWIKVIELYLERNKVLKLRRERDAFNKIINPFSPHIWKCARWNDLNEWWSQIKGVILIEKDFLKLKKQIIFILFKLLRVKFLKLAKFQTIFNQFSDSILRILSRVDTFAPRKLYQRILFLKLDNKFLFPRAQLILCNVYRPNKETDSREFSWLGRAEVIPFFLLLWRRKMGMSDKSFRSGHVETIKSRRTWNDRRERTEGGVVGRQL